jgi:hypothetical protein
MHSNNGDQMTHAEHAVAVLRNAISNSPAVDPAFRRGLMDDINARRVKELESVIREFCNYVYENSEHIGASAGFHKLFRELAESVGFDAYPEDGPDPDAAYDRRDE